MFLRAGAIRMMIRWFSVVLAGLSSIASGVSTAVGADASFTYSSRKLQAVASTTPPDVQNFQIVDQDLVHAPGPQSILDNLSASGGTTEFAGTWDMNGNAINIVSPHRAEASICPDS